MTEDPEKIPERGDVSPEGDEIFVGEFNSLGYNSNGYDRRGFDRLGYNVKGIHWLFNPLQHNAAFWHTKGI